jgi:hypothetical protein
MERLTVYWLLAILTPAVPSNIPSRANATTAQCGDSTSQEMAFLRGDWKGLSYSISSRDTTLDATMQIRSESLYGGCVLEEQWEAEQAGKRLFQARVIRAYDAPTRRWLVYYADDQLNSQFYEGKLEGGHWRFIRSRMDNGTRIFVRLTWKPTSNGYEQLIERSRDAGKTWTLGGFARFEPAAANPQRGA